MFGYDNNQQDNQAQATANEPSTNNDNNFGAPAVATDTPSDSSNSMAPPHEPQTVMPSMDNNDSQSHHDDSNHVDMPAEVADELVSEDSSPAPAADASSGDLLDIKQQALQHLTPLVGHLDQTPEEKFRTTMMMIQGSDDQSLVPQAFESAKQITDDKTRAQALLDIINEINYFTQQHKN